MSRPIEDAVVVITGASSGIGRATALEFASRGATVVLAARREPALHDVARSCERLGSQALVVPTDVSNEQAVRNLALQAIEHFGRIDVWVNNAAVTLFGRVEETPPDVYRRVIETNFFGYFHGARAVLPYFREQGQGVLINVSSVVSKIGQPYTSAYVSSKFAITGLSECLRMEVMDVPGIHVCTVLPPSIDTPLFQQAANYTGRIPQPMPPVYDPEQVAHTIVKLAESPKREILIGGAAYQMHLLRTLMPGFAESQMAKKVDRDHFQDRPAENTAGNLYDPMPEYARVHGGWKHLNTGQTVTGLGVATLVAIGLGLVAGWWLTRPESRPLRTRLSRIGEDLADSELVRRSRDWLEDGAQWSRHRAEDAARWSREKAENLFA